MSIDCKKYIMINSGKKNWRKNNKKIPKKKENKEREKNDLNWKFKLLFELIFDK